MKKSWLALGTLSENGCEHNAERAHIVAANVVQELQTWTAVQTRGDPRRATCHNYPQLPWFACLLHLCMSVRGATRKCGLLRIVISRNMTKLRTAAADLESECLHSHGLSSSSWQASAHEPPCGGPHLRHSAWLFLSLPRDHLVSPDDPKKHGFGS